jgi:Putative peptidoglycan binding domain
MNLGHGRLPALLLVVLLAAAPLSAATRTTNAHRARRAPVGSKVAHRHRASSKTAKRGAKPRKPNAYQRLAKMQIDPGRVENIQRALGDAGIYHGATTGMWDSATREAMARYQARNGFGVTGLPDAKSLMKLGLGPHPLPAELDRTRAANLQPNAPDAAGAAHADAASPITPGSQNPPER